MINPNFRFGISDEHTVIGDGPASPFYLDGWLKWNEKMWGLKAERVLYTDGKSDYPCLEGVLYTNKKGQVVQPPRNPHLPFRFISTATKKKNKLYNQYLDIMQIFARDLLSRGVNNQINLPPGFMDARPFQWNGFVTNIRYTFMSELPYDIKNCDSSVRNKIKKSEKMGCCIREAEDWNAVEDCLSDTESRKSFDHRTNRSSLILCKELLQDNFKVYLGYTNTGLVISAGLRLMAQNGIGYFWSQGTKREYLNTGIVQLLHQYVLDSLHRDASCVLADWGGANTPPVALAKSAWGMPLVPYITIRRANIRYIARVCKSYLDYNFLGR